MTFGFLNYGPPGHGPGRDRRGAIPPGMSHKCQVIRLYG
jgi:hypothetical protein